MRQLAAVLAFALMGIVPAPAGAADLAAPGTLVLSGSKPGQVRSMRIPRKILISDAVFPRNADVTISGGGRFAGAIILGLDDPSYWVVLGRLPKTDSCTEEDLVAEAIPVPLPECPEGHPVLVSTSTPTFGEGIEIPAGRYRILFIPDGKSATVTLRFPPLKGTAKPKLVPNVTAHSARSESEVPAANLFSGGATHNLGKPAQSLIFTSLTAVVTASAATRSGYCAYPQSPVETDIRKAHPACGPLARSGEGAAHGNSSALRERDHRTALVKGMQGPTSVGWWYATNGYIHNASVTTVWVGYGY